MRVQMRSVKAKGEIKGAWMYDVSHIPCGNLYLHLESGERWSSCQLVLPYPHITKILLSVSVVAVSTYQNIFLIAYRWAASCVWRSSGEYALHISNASGVIGDACSPLCLDGGCIFFKHGNSFVFIWQLVYNHGLIMFERFVSWFTTKLCN
jgi:hypothetical protein